MNISEMSRLLATVSLIDPRVSRRSDEEKELMAKAWLVVVGETVPYDFAAKCAQEHYKNSSDVFMPVHIVSRWKIERQRGQEIAQINEITAQRDENSSKGMPDSVRAELRRIGLLKT